MLTSAISELYDLIPDPEKDKVNHATVYRIIDSDQEAVIRDNGLTVPEGYEDDRRGDVKTTVENIFEEVIRQRLKSQEEVIISRKKCIFAFPRDPTEVFLGMSPNEEGRSVVALDIDPSKALVAEGECFTEAVCEFDFFESYDQAVERARKWAENYWEEAMLLTDYLEDHYGQEDDWSDFAFPEVLIFEDIPASAIHTVEKSAEDVSQTGEVLT